MNLNELKHQTECHLESIQGGIAVTPEYLESVLELISKMIEIEDL